MVTVFRLGRYRRSGSVGRLLVFMLCSMIAVLALSFAALHLRPDANRSVATADQVRIYCAAGVVKPVEKIAQSYNELFDANVEIVRTGGSGELAGQIKTEFETNIKSGADLYLTADDVLLQQAREQGIIARSFQLAAQRPVVAVRVDNALEINSLEEMIDSSQLKFGICSQRAAAGKIVRQLARQSGKLNELENRIATESENVMTLAQALAAGSLDAAVIWDTTVNQLNQTVDRPVLRIASYAEASNELGSSVAVGMINRTKSPTAALKFCQFLSGSKVAEQAFQEFGFNVIQGDTWP